MTLLPSGFAQASMAALIAMVLVGAARADTIETFDVEGTAVNRSHMDLGSCAADETCSFSGTMMVDVTSSAAFPNGTVAASDIIFPGLAAFDMLEFQGRHLGTWTVRSEKNIAEELVLDFTTTPSRRRWWALTVAVL